MLLYFYRRLCGSDGGDAWYEKMLKVFQLFMLYISKMCVQTQIALKPDFGGSQD
jgi:hypothetical protein